MAGIETAEQVQRGLSVDGGVGSRGFGSILSSSELFGSAQAVIKAVCDSLFVVVKGLALSADDLRTISQRLGMLVHHKQDAASVGYGYGDVLSLNADSDPDKVVTGRGMLPLHTDGVLLATPVDFSLLYCVSQRGDPASGATHICDQETAWKEMPRDLRAVFEENGLEYQAVEAGYFPPLAGQSWFSVPAFKEYERGPALNIALPFAEGAPASWRVRVAGVGEDLSKRKLAEIATFLSQPRYTYVHAWCPGDLLIFDNHYTLHGRSAIHPGAAREVLRSQIVVERTMGDRGRG